MTEMGVPLTPEDIHKTVKLSYLFSANRPLTKTVEEGGKIDGLNGWTVLEIRVMPLLTLRSTMKKR